MGPNCGGWLRETWSSRSFSRWTSQRRFSDDHGKAGFGRPSLPRFWLIRRRRSLPRRKPAPAHSKTPRPPRSPSSRTMANCFWTTAVALRYRALNSRRPEARRTSACRSGWRGRTSSFAPSLARPIAGGARPPRSLPRREAMRRPRSSRWVLRYWRKVSRVSGPIRLLRPALRNIAPPRRSRGTRGAGFGPMPQCCPSQPGRARVRSCNARAWWFWRAR